MADSSLDFDRTTKMQLYAETGVPEYWISDLQNDCIIVYSDLDNTAYRNVQQFRWGEKLTPRLVSDCSIPVESLLP